MASFSAIKHITNLSPASPSRNIIRLENLCKKHEKTLFRAWQRCTVVHPFYEACIDDPRIHDLCQHFASSLWTKGVDLLDIEEYLDHKSIAMIMSHAHTTTERKKWLTPIPGALLNMEAHEVR